MIQQHTALQILLINYSPGVFGKHKAAILGISWRMVLDFLMLEFDVILSKIYERVMDQ